MSDERPIRILLTDHFEMELIARLEDLQNTEILYRPDMTRAELMEELGTVDALIIKSKTTIDAELLAAGHRSRPKLIVRAGAGTDHIDVEEVKRRGIHLATTKGANADAVGEHALGMLLALTNHIARADRQVRQFQWRREPNRGVELAGRTAAIIGYGFTGRAFAKRLTGIGVNVLAYDKYKSDFSDPYAREANLREIFQRADILSFHVPLTEETRDYYDSSLVDRFKRPLWLINCARGPVVNTACVLSALQSGRLRGAALDVLENEDLDNLEMLQKQQLTQLAQLDNVILTPHIAGWSAESAERINAQVLEETMRYFNLRSL
jgi:D-3-phosphoglycerate dehydrogenase